MHEAEISHLKEIAALRRRIDAFQSQSVAGEKEEGLAGEKEKELKQKETVVTPKDTPFTATFEKTPDSSDAKAK